ncbi:HEAT repeat domain-containing protein [Planctomycetota bacterium]
MSARGLLPSPPASVVAAVLLVVVGACGFAGEDEPRLKSIPHLIRELTGNDATAATVAKEELGRRGKEAVPALRAVITNPTAKRRDLAVIALGMIRDPDTTPLLIDCLTDDDWRVRGRAAYALSQIGGDEAKAALVRYLDEVVEHYRAREMAKAAESLKELPDPRALPSLIRILGHAHSRREVGYAPVYAAQALGKIGDARASGPIARLLDPSAPYSRSRDLTYLVAILRTRGKGAVASLVSYLALIVEKMKGEPQRAPLPIPPQGRPLPMLKPRLGADARQRIHNYLTYSLAVACLEAIAGQPSKGTTREEILRHWQDYWAKLRASYIAQVTQIRVGYAVHFTRLELTIDDKLIDYRLHLQGPGEHYKRSSSPNTLKALAKPLLESKLFGEGLLAERPERASDASRPSPRYGFAITLRDGTILRRSVAHDEVFRKGKYPLIGAWLGDARHRFTRLAPQDHQP